MEKNLHFNRLIPVDDVSRKHKRLNVHHMDVPSFRSHVKPFALEGQKCARDPEK